MYIRGNILKQTVEMTGIKRIIYALQRLKILYNNVEGLGFIQKGNSSSSVGSEDERKLTDFLENTVYSWRTLDSIIEECGFTEQRIDEIVNTINSNEEGFIRTKIGID